MRPGPGEPFSPMSDDGSLLRLPAGVAPPNSFECSSAAAAARLRRDELLLSMPDRPIVPSIDFRWLDVDVVVAESWVEADDSLRGVDPEPEDGVEGTGGRGLAESAEASFFMDWDDDRRKNGIELGVRRLLDEPGVCVAKSGAEGGASDAEGGASDAELGCRRAGSDGGGGDGMT